MKREILLRITSLLIFLALAASCRRDPNTLKQRYITSGNKYFVSGKYRQAEIMYRNALKVDQRYGEAHYRYALLKVKQGAYYDAAPGLRRAVELLPEGPIRVDARVKLAEVYLIYMDNVERTDAALKETGELADQLLALDARSFYGLWIRGRVATVRARWLAETGHRAGASDEIRASIADFRAADSVRPGQQEVILFLARSLWDDGQADEAVKALNVLIAKNKTAVGAYADLHRIYGLLNRPGDVERTLVQAIENNPQETRFYSELASFYMEAGKPDEGLKVLSRLKAQARNYPEAYQISGAYYLRLGDPAKAIAEYELGIKAFPKESVRFRKLVVETLVFQGKRGEAMQLNQAILRENPKDGDALVRRGEFFLENGENEKALNELKELVRLAPTHAAAHYSLGRAMLANAQPGTARFEFSEAIRLAPELVPARLALSQIELDSGEFLKAVVSAEEILKTDSRNSSAKLIRALGLTGMKRFGEARAQYQMLLAANPRFADGWFHLGLLEESQNQLHDAEAAFRKSYEASPNSRGLMAMVEFSERHNQIDHAIEILRAELKKRSPNLDVWIGYADLLARHNRSAAATAEYKQILAALGKEDEAAGKIHLRLGAIYRKSGDNATALGHLEKARQFLPGDAGALHNLATLYEVLGRREDARKAFEMSLKLNGDNGIALNNLACYLLDSGGDLAQALTYAQAARRKLPNRPEVADTLGMIYFRQNLNENAIEVFAELVSKDPKDATFRYHLGMALAKKGEKEAAKKELRSALACKPSAEEARKIRELMSSIG